MIVKNDISPDKCKDEIFIKTILQEKAKKLLNDYVDLNIIEEPTDKDYFKTLLDDILAIIYQNQELLCLIYKLRSHEYKIFTHAFQSMMLSIGLAHQYQFERHKLIHLGVATLLLNTCWIAIPIVLITKEREYDENEKSLISKSKVENFKHLSKLSDIDQNTLALIAHYYHIQSEQVITTGYNQTQFQTCLDILSVSDLYGSLLNGLYQHKRHSPFLALRHIYQSRIGEEFSFEVYNSLLTFLQIYPITLAVQLDTGEKGIVIEENRKSPNKPKVLLVYDGNAKIISPPHTLNLSQTEQKIISIVDSSSMVDDPHQLLRFNRKSA